MLLRKKEKGISRQRYNPAKFHGTGPFDDGYRRTDRRKQRGDTYTDIFSKVLCDDGKTKENSRWQLRRLWQTEQGLPRFSRQFPKRFFDVGIAEEHAMTFAAGLAAGGHETGVCTCILPSYRRAFDQTHP